MKLPLSWLKDFVPVRLSAEKLAEVLTLSGSEVEKIERGPKVDGVVVGHVLKVEKHPNADRLRVCQVQVDANAPRTIVCGAPNITVGQKVPVALPGTTLPNGLTLEKATIRGVASEGMVCAADELGLGEDHSGILVLNPAAKIGTPAGQWLGSGDTVLDLDITPNRGDCLSIRGLAREVAALTNQNVRTPVIKLQEDKAKADVKVKIADVRVCPEYVVRIIDGVQVGESPIKIQDRLRAAGLRPVNAVVDATNYVMLELGQPLHAFDGKSIRSIVVRRALSNESLTTLDGVRRSLVQSDIVITDGKKVIALAGVMGGAETSVSNATTKIVLESARFDPISVRKTAQRLSLRSDASTRFEKGIDPAVAVEAVDRAAAYIAEWCGGVVLRGRVRAGKAAPAPKRIAVTLDHVSKLLGISITASQAKKLLVSLGCKVAGSTKVLQVTPPTWRMDLRIPEDVIEELGRLTDYNTLTPTLPVTQQHIPTFPPEYQLVRTTRQRLVAAGSTEVATFSFYSQQLAQAFALADEPHMAVANPLNPDQALLRRSLMPLLLSVAGKQSADRDQLSIFEVGRVFWPTSSNRPPEERRMLGMVVVDQHADAFLRVKGLVADLCHALGLPDVRIHASTNRSARILAGAEPIGIIGWVGEKYATAAKLKRPAAFCEIDLSLVATLPTNGLKVKPVPLYPSVERDIALVLPAGKLISHVDLARTIRAVDPLILSVKGFDRFTLPDQRLSVALHITFQSPGKSLTGHEVQAILDTVTRAVRDAFGAELRT